MKIEPRGKYAGVKVHLDEAECQTLLSIYEARGDDSDFDKDNNSFNFSVALGRMIYKLLQKEPGLFKERSHAQVYDALLLEYEEAMKKLDRMDRGEKWNG